MPHPGRKWLLVALGAALLGSVRASDPIVAATPASAPSAISESYLLIVHSVPIASLFEISRRDGVERVRRTFSIKQGEFTSEQLSVAESAATLRLFRKFDWNVKLSPKTEPGSGCTFDAPPRITFHAWEDDSHRMIQADASRMNELADLIATLVSEAAASRPAHPLLIPPK